MADQSVGERLGSGDVFAGQQDLGGNGVRNLAAEAYSRATHRVQRPPGLADTEAGRFAGDADIGGLQNLGASGNGHALDRSDQRLGRPVVSQQRLPVQRGIGLHPRRGVDLGVGIGRIARHRPQVGSRAKVPARSGEDNAADFGIFGRLDKGVIHPHHHRSAQRVEACRPVQSDGHYAAVALHQCVGHTDSPVVRGPLRRPGGSMAGRCRRMLRGTSPSAAFPW